MNQQLINLFLKAEHCFKHRKYKIKVMNEKKFIEKNLPKDQPIPNELATLFEFDEKRLTDYVIDFLMFKWFYDHNDTRYKEMTVILIPAIQTGKSVFDMKDIPMEELIDFLSPQTKISNSKVSNKKKVTK